MSKNDIKKTPLPYQNGAELAEVREAAELTQHDLAELVGIAQPNLAALESGRRVLSAKMGRRIAEALKWYLRPPTKAEAKASKRRALVAVQATSLRK
jgi:uncharacterized protein